MIRAWLRILFATPEELEDAKQLGDGLAGLEFEEEWTDEALGDSATAETSFEDWEPTREAMSCSEGLFIFGRRTTKTSSTLTFLNITLVMSDILTYIVAYDAILAEHFCAPLGVEHVCLDRRMLSILQRVVNECENSYPTSLEEDERMLANMVGTLHKYLFTACK